MKKLYMIICGALLSTNVIAIEGKNYSYIDPSTGETFYFTKSQKTGNSQFVAMTREEVFKLVKHQYTKNIFHYTDKIGNKNRCTNLNEAVILDAKLVDDKRWVAELKNMDGLKDTYDFPPNATFMNTTNNGYAFCVKYG